MSETKQKKLAVVSQLPTQQVKEGEIDGVNYEFLTTDEAMTEMLEALREIRGKL